MTQDGVRCPICRAMSYPGLMGFPRCHQCHEQLRQCRYCQHQTLGLCRLEAGRRPRLEADEGKPYCASFASRLLIPVSRGAARPVGSDLRLLGVVAAVVLAVVVAFNLLLGDAGHDLRVEPDEPRVFVSDNRALATFVVTSDPGFLSKLRLRVDAEALRYYQLESPPAVEISGGAPVVRIQPDHLDRARITLTLAQFRPAPVEQRLSVTLLSPRGSPLANAETLLVTANRLRSGRRKE